MAETITRLSPGRRTGLQIGAVLILVVAAGLMVFTPVAMFSAPPTPMGMAVPFVMLALTGLMFMVGISLARLAFLKSVSEIVSTETEAAVENTATAIGKGLRGAGIGGTSTVQLRCRSCGALDSEDARIFSACAAPM